MVVNYFQNRTICQNANGITSYKAVNKILLSVAHPSVLGCSCHTYVPDTTLHHTLDNSRRKDIVVGL